MEVKTLSPVSNLRIFFVRIVSLTVTKSHVMSLEIIFFESEGKMSQQMDIKPILRHFSNLNQSSQRVLSEYMTCQGIEIQN